MFVFCAVAGCQWCSKPFGVPLALLLHAGITVDASSLLPVWFLVQTCMVACPTGCTGVGEVHVKSEQLFSHYWQKPEATREAFDDQGYFITGDAPLLF
jgi:long-subunit acyl-CoA synthetase (AMP-forming)